VVADILYLTFDSSRFSCVKMNSLDEVFSKDVMLRSKELEERGVSRVRIAEFEKSGEIVKLDRGIYALPDFSPTENHSLALIGKLIPNARICLLSALSFHDLTTQLPFEAWIALRPKDRKPQIQYSPIRLSRFSGASWELGIEDHEVEGVRIKVYSVAKTIVDLFRYRNKIGVDVAMEALREGWRKKRFEIDEINGLAKSCRMQKVMYPYLELMVTQ